MYIKIYIFIKFLNILKNYFLLYKCNFYFIFVDYWKNIEK